MAWHVTQDPKVNSGDTPIPAFTNAEMAWHITQDPKGKSGDTPILAFTTVKTAWHITQDPRARLALQSLEPVNQERKKHRFQ